MGDRSQIIDLCIQKVNLASLSCARSRGAKLDLRIRNIEAGQREITKERRRQCGNVGPVTHCDVATEAIVLRIVLTLPGIQRQRGLIKVSA